MKWLGLQSILALITTGVESKCGEFSPSKIVLEEPATIVETKLGEPVALTLKLPDHKYITIVLTAPNGKDYPLNNLDKTVSEENYEYVINESNISDTKDVQVLRMLDNEIEKYRISYNMFKKEVDSREENEECKERRAENRIEESKMLKELVLGPITEDYFGNWVITACHVNAGRETEIFKVISIHIEESIKTVPPDSTTIKLHQDLFLRLGRSFTDLQSCELMGPSGSGDRPFERDLEHLDSCGFILRNVGVCDLGSWKVVAVGRVVYVGTLDLNIYY